MRRERTYRAVAASGEVRGIIVGALDPETAQQPTVLAFTLHKLESVACADHA